MKLALLIALGLLTGCAAVPQRAAVSQPTVVKPAHFTAEAFFVLEFEHDAAGHLVHAASYGPAYKEQEAINGEVIQEAKARQYNPPGHFSQFTIQHVLFDGPVRVKEAIVQPVQQLPPGWVLFATDFDALGKYLGSEVLHGVTLLKDCKTHAHNIIKDNEDTIPHGASLLIYCVPVPPLPTATTLPNGDSVI